MAGTALGSIKVAIPLGGILLPFMMSLLAEYAGFQISLLVFPLASLLGLTIMYSAFRKSANLARSPAYQDALAFQNRADE
jgi:hypothetical protein